MKHEVATVPETVSGRWRVRCTGIRRLLHNKPLVVGLFLFVAIALLCLLGPMASRYGATTIDLMASSQPPSAAHWFGTDQTGRDMFVRTLEAGRVSLSVGVLSALLAMLIGVVLGGVSGYFGERVDNLVMRLVDVVMIFPASIVLMTLAAVLGPGTGKTIVIIGILSAPLACRLVRSRILTIRELDFVAAARMMGAGHTYIIVRHCLPNTFDVVLSFGSLSFVSAILTEAGLSFLGLGVQMPFASWGSLLSAASDASIMQAYPWVWLPAGMLLVFTALAVNFFGDGLRVAFDPRTKQEN